MKQNVQKLFFYSLRVEHCSQSCYHSVLPFFMISKNFISVLACVTQKHCLLNFIGVVLWLLNSQWKMHHCDVPCSFFLVFFGSAEHLYCKCFCALNSASPPTHFTRAPPLHTKNRYLNSRLMILHASELEKELFDEVQSPRCTFATSIRLQSLPAWSRHVQGITQYKMASNIQLTTGRDREIAGLILLFR